MNATSANARRRALLSVSDKTGIVAFGRRLEALGFEILSTGGTAALLTGAGVGVTSIAAFTGHPEIMGGRVKTLHPRVHGGLLGRVGEDETVMAELGIPRIELAVINLYPFEEVIRRPECSLAEAIENIDIGGPALVRSAAKNHAAVAVVTSPAQYPAVLERLETGDGRLDERFRFELAVAAFNRIAAYDAAISNYLAAFDPAGHALEFPGRLNLSFDKLMDLRYGENPHQRAAWYRDAGGVPLGLAAARQLQGKPLSFNNLADADAAWSAVQSFAAPACVIVKHANPCGAAVAARALEAYERAHATDPVSAFGGIIAFNTELDLATARRVIEQQFVEVLLAPAVTPPAVEALAAKPGVRVLAVDATAAAPSPDLRRIAGGLLVQSADPAGFTRADCRVVSRRQPTEAEWRDLEFTWQVARWVKSNAIVFGREGRTLGIGAGQMSRVDSARIARWKAGEANLDLAGSAMASDAFFPFRDGIDAAAEAGVAAVIQPGGSVRDDEVIAAADAHGMAMVFTGMRHFRH